MRKIKTPGPLLHRPKPGMTFASRYWPSAVLSCSSAGLGAGEETRDEIRTVPFLNVRAFAAAAFVCALLISFPGRGAAQEIAIDAQWLQDHGPSPYYLDQPNAVYTLQTEVSSPGSAFAMIAAGITLDLNGRTITYDNSPPIAVNNGSFEDGASGWDLSQAPGAAVGPGPFSGALAWTGPNALRFSVPAAGGAPDEQAVIALGTVTLAPNTTYDLSFRAYNTTADQAVLYASFSGTGVEAAWNGRTWRGMQYTTASITTGSSPAAYTIVAGIRGAGSASPGTLYIDDIRVQTSRVFGVVAGPANWGEEWRRNHYPDITRFGSAANAVIKNGSITQGTGAGNKSHAIYEFSSENIELTGLTITVNGPNTHNFGAYYAAGARIHHNTLYNNVTTITSRDGFDGTVVQAGAQGEIYNNTIIGGCQNGIVAAGNANIHHNTISLRGRYTNGFAIQLYGDNGSQVHDNHVLCGQGEFSSRGIFAGGNAQNTRIFNNTVQVQELPLNQEYGGGQGGTNSGAYGIQVESSDNIEIYGNDVTAFAREWTANAFRMNADLGDRNIYVNDNTFRALKTGRGAFASNDDNLLTANSVKIDGGVNTAAAQLRFERNTLVSNSRWLACSDISNLELRETTLEAAAARLDAFQPLVALRYASGAGGALSGLRFIDSSFVGDGARTAVYDGAIYKKFYTNFGVDAFSSFRYAWSLALHVSDVRNQDVAGAAVQITDSRGQEVFSGVTDVWGRVEAAVDEFQKTGADIQPGGNPHTIRVSRDGYQEDVRSITVVQPLSLSIVLNVPGNAPAAPRNLRIR